MIASGGARISRVQKDKNYINLTVPVASIREFGFTNPILSDPDGSVIAGHGRLLAAKAMALTEVPAIILEGLGDAQQPALRLADNQCQAPWVCTKLCERPGTMVSGTGRSIIQ